MKHLCDLAYLLHSVLWKLQPIVECLQNKASLIQMFFRCTWNMYHCPSTLIYMWEYSHHSEFVAFTTIVYNKTTEISGTYQHWSWVMADGNKTKGKSIWATSINYHYCIYTLKILISIRISSSMLVSLVHSIESSRTAVINCGKKNNWQLMKYENFKI